MLLTQSKQNVEAARLKRAFCKVMATVARTVPQTPTLTEIAQLAPAIPHLESAAHHLIDFYSDEDVLRAFIGIAWFYQGQGQYQQGRTLVHCLLQHHKLPFRCQSSGCGRQSQQSGRTVQSARTLRGSRTAQGWRDEAIN